MLPIEIVELARALYSTDPHSHGLSFEDTPELLQHEYHRKAQAMVKAMEKRGFSLQPIAEDE